MKTGDHVLLEKLIKARVDLSTYVHATHHGLYPIAAREGHLGIVRVLLDLNKNELHVESAHDHLPLVCALLKGHLEVARFMVSQGALVDFTVPHEERTALSFAAEQGPLASVRFLVEETTSDLEFRDPRGWTPLLHAAARGPLEVLKYLVKAGADPKVKDNAGKTALFLAAVRGKEDTVLFLLENPENFNFFLQDLDGISLARIASKGKGRIADLLLSRINLHDRIASAAGCAELSALMFASAACGSYSSVQLLLERGFDHLVQVQLETRPEQRPEGPRRQFHKYDNAVRQTAANGHANVIWLFLGSIRAQGPSSLRSSITDVIRIASETNETRLLHDILDCEMTRQLDSATLKTCLSEALKLAVTYEEATRLLLDHGASPDRDGDSGFHVLQMEVKQGNKESVRLLLNATGLNPLHPLNYPRLDDPVIFSSLEMIKVLLETNDNVDFHPANEECQQTLSNAVFRGSVEVVQYFLDHGFNVNCKVPLGSIAGTPLLVMAARRIVSDSDADADAMAKLLLNRGAEVDIMDPSQRTALWWAANRMKKAAVQTLLDHGADPLLKDFEGRSPLDESVSWCPDGKSLKAILRAMEARGTQFDLTDVMRKAKENWTIPQEEKENKPLKYLIQHHYRTMYPCC